MVDLTLLSHHRTTGWFGLTSPSVYKRETGYSADGRLFPYTGIYIIYDISNWESTSQPFEVTTSGGKKILSGILVFKRDPMNDLQQAGMYLWHC